MHKTAVGVIWKSFQNSFRISWILTHFVQKQRYSDLPKYSKYRLFEWWNHSTLIAYKFLTLQSVQMWLVSSERACTHTYTHRSRKTKEINGGEVWKEWKEDRTTTSLSSIQTVYLEISAPPISKNSWDYKGVLKALSDETNHICTLWSVKNL